MASFINSLQSIYTGYGETNSTTPAPCEEAINHYKFYQYTLVPAVILTMVFAMTKSRKNIMLNLLKGRPGLIFPMDTLTRSSRISYGCAFGATAFLVYKIVLEQTYAIEYQGHAALKSFIAIASMFIYGMVFFPLFSSLAIGSVVSYALGSLYVWLLTVVDVYKVTECDLDTQSRILVVFRGLPSLICLLYLSISMPIRMVVAYKNGKYFYWDDEFDETNTLEDIRNSYSGHHVVKLFHNPMPPAPPEGLKEKIFHLVAKVFSMVVYQREKGFRYPSRIIAVMFISLMVLYTVTFELMAIIPPAVGQIADLLLLYIDQTIGLEEQPYEDPSYSSLRELLFIIYYFIDVFRICVIVSNVVAAVFAVLNVLHSLSSFRANLYALYRGDHSHIPPQEAYSNTTHCINSIKYAGFQVGYNIWSFLLQFIILLLVSFILACAIILIKNDFTFFFEWGIELAWPIVLTAVLVMLIQLLLAKFCFLQDRGAYLALNNRSFYFNFAYFMFFYNIFLGLVSCLMRILKAMFVGVVFLSRLDSSTLPRRFEFIDPGFKAYVGFMHMEAAHTHPVVVVFCRQMLLGLEMKRRRLVAREGGGGGGGGGVVKYSVSPRSHVVSPINGWVVEVEMKQNPDETGVVTSKTDIKLQMNGAPPMDICSTEEEWRRRTAARFNWHVLYTLLHNPDIRVMRKGYVQMLRQARQLGVRVPVSDTQADINFDQLQQDINDAKEGRAAKDDESDGKAEEEDQVVVNVGEKKDNLSMRM